MIDAEKAFSKIQHPVMILKNLPKIEIEGIYVQVVIAIYNEPTANIILYDGILKAFPLRSDTR